MSNLGLLSGLKLSVCERKKKVNNFSYSQGGGHDWEQFSTPWIKKSFTFLTQAPRKRCYNITSALYRCTCISRKRLSFIFRNCYLQKTTSAREFISMPTWRTFLERRGKAGWDREQGLLQKREGRGGIVIAF